MKREPVVHFDFEFDHGTWLIEVSGHNFCNSLSSFAFITPFGVE